MIIESKAPPEAKSENGNHCKVNIEPRHPDDNEGSEDHTMIVDETKTLLQDQSRPKRISFSKLSPVVTPEDNGGSLTVSKKYICTYFLKSALMLIHSAQNLKSIFPLRNVAIKNFS